MGAAHALFSNVPDRDERSGWLQACLERAAMETNGNITLSGELAGWVLLAYAHWMKMPMNLLLPHLVRKSRMRMTFNKDVGLGQA